MTTLDLGAMTTPNGELEVGLRKGWVQHFRLVLSSAGPVALVVAILALLEKQPNPGFGLLTSWGPWPVVILVALAILGKFLSRLSDSLQTTFSAVVQNSHQTAEAQSKMAEAISGLAQQGGAQVEEVRRLTMYAAQEFPVVYDRFEKVEIAIGELGENVKKLLDRG